MTSSPGSERDAAGAGDIARLLRETQELSAAVAASARRLDETATTLDRVLAELADSEEPGWRVAGWYLSCIALMAVALLAILYGAQGFGSPAPSAPEPSAVQLAVSVPAGTPVIDPLGKTEKFYLAADYAQGSAAATSYTLWFPKEVAGRQFALLLLGAATMTDVKGAGLTVATTNHDCVLDDSSTLTPRSAKPQPEPCQAVTGTVPTGTTTVPPLDCSLALADRSAYIPVQIKGDTALSSKPDWAHQVTQVPSLSGDRFGAVTLTSWNGLPLESTMATATQSACKRLGKQDTWELAAAVPEPSDITSYQLTWDRERSAAADVVVTRNREAQSSANIWIGGAGAAIALGVGFLPVAYESGREWLRGRRRRRAIADAERAATV